MMNAFATSRRVLVGSILGAALSCCGGNGEEGEFDRALVEAGILSADDVDPGESSLAVEVRGSGEALDFQTAPDPLVVSREAGRLVLELALANSSADRPLENIALGILDDGEDAAAPEVVNAGTIEPGGRREIRGSWTLSEKRRPELVLAAAFDDGGRRRRILIHLGPVRPGLALESVATSGETATSSTGRVPPRRDARQLGYDILLARRESRAFELAFTGSEPRFAAAANLRVRRAPGGSVDAQIVDSQVAAGGARRLELVLDASGARAGVHGVEVLARYLVGGELVERAWSLRVGVYEARVLSNRPALKIDFDLPSGARASWEGTGGLPDRPSPKDLPSALEFFSMRVTSDLPAAIALGRLDYIPPAERAPDREALSHEISATLGAAVGYALLRTQIREDLARALPDQPALGQALTRRAADLGSAAGIAILRSALDGWAPAPGPIPMAGSSLPEELAPRLVADEFAPLLAAASIVPATAQWGAEPQIPLAGVGSITAASLPLSLAYDLRGLPGRADAEFELTLLGDASSDIALSVRSKASSGDSVELSIDRVPPGEYRASVVARWPGGRFVAGPSLGVSITAPPPPVDPAHPAQPAHEKIPSDLLELLSPRERERLARGPSFKKIVAVERGGRLELSRREFVVEKGRAVDAGDVGVEIVRARFDEAANRTVVEFRLTSRQTKRWNLSVRPVADAGDLAAAPVLPVEAVAIDLSEGEPETVSLTFDGRFGDSFTLLEHSISGSPTAFLARFRVYSASGSGFACPSTSFDAAMGALKRLALPRTSHWISSIRLAEFLGAGGAVQIRGTGGPEIEVQILRLPDGLDATELLIPAGTAIEGGGAVQRLVIPYAITVPLLADGGPPLRARAYCSEKGKPFPASEGNLAPSGDAPGHVSRFVEVASALVGTGRYPALGGVDMSAAEEILQVLIWAYLELPADARPNPELSGRMLGALRHTLARLPEYESLGRDRIEEMAKEAGALFLDALLATRGAWSLAPAGLRARPGPEDVLGPIRARIGELRAAIDRWKAARGSATGADLAEIDAAIKNATRALREAARDLDEAEAALSGQNR